MAGATVILAAAVGVVVALVAAAVAPGNESTTVASDTRGSTSTTELGVPMTGPPLVTAEPPTRVLVLPTTPPPPGRVTVITTTPTLVPEAPEVRAADPPGPTSSSTLAVEPVTLAQRLDARLTRRLGASNRGVSNRVVVTVDEQILTVSWALDRPHAADGSDAHAEANANAARSVELRAELRRALRALAGSTLHSVDQIVLTATYSGVGGADASENIVLQAIVSSITLGALEPDDVRLDDASLEELLGLAEHVTGDPTWGVPPAAGPDDHPSVAP